jgi:hypothetical protein
MIEWIGMRVTAKKGIKIFDAAEIAADGNVLNCAFVVINIFRFIPGATILMPGNHAFRCGQINIHVSPG